MATIFFLIQTYGYAIIFIGTFLEGEAILILGGFFASGHYLKLPLVILTAFVASVMSDQILFYVGRYKGRKLIQKYNWLQKKSEEVHKKMEKHENLIIFGFRFLYGFRIITPLTLGTSNVNNKKFAILNIISALVWASTFGTIGYLIKNTFDLFITRFQKVQKDVVIAFLIIIILNIIFKLLKRKGNDLLE